MFHAISESNSNEMAVIANRLDRTFRASPTEDLAKDLSPEAAPEAPDANVPETVDVVNEPEDDDDALDLDNEVF